MEKLNLLSVQKASQASGIPYKLLLGATKNGQIKVLTLSRRPYIPAGALKAFIQEANKPERHAKAGVRRDAA